MPSLNLSHRPWNKALSRYQQPHLGRSILEIVLSAAPLAAIWTAGWFTHRAGLWPLTLLLAAVAGAFVVRLFMVQHDCSHRAFFRSAAANDWTGRVLGVLTATPHDCWRHSHAIHHASSGNLDRRGLGAIDTLTVEEYRALGRAGRLRYRLLRHPLVLFALGPSILFLVLQRLPLGFTRQGWRPWLSAMSTNAALAAVILAVAWLGGWGLLVFLYLPTLMVASSIGVWLFYIQHQFEGTSWAREGEWDRTDSALLGSSYYVLPTPLRWLTANIGMHHVHHLSARIPFYRLPRVLKDHPELEGVSRIGMRQSLKAARLALWDESNGRLVSFAEARALPCG